MSAFLATLVTVFLWHSVGQQLANSPTDSTWYREMAAGKAAVKPFGNRVLAPFVAHRLARLTGTSNDAGFYAIGVVSIWVAVFGVLLPVVRHRQAFGLCLALVPMFFWRDLFRNYFLPDLPHTALLVVFFCLLRARWWKVAAAMLLPLYLARESTLLLSLIAVPILWRLLGRGTGLLFLAASLAGAGASKIAARHALPNIHHLDDTLYLIAKVPWNFSRNVLGISLWTDTFVGGVTPAHVWRVPPGLHLGGIHQVGYYAPSYLDPVNSMITLLFLFGLGPCVALCLLSRVPLRQLLPRTEPSLCIAAVYGTVAYLLAPSLGASVLRLVGYGWPLFLIYIPAVMPRFWPIWRPWQTVCLLAAHLVPGWLVVTGVVALPFPRLTLLLAADAIGAVLLLYAPTPMRETLGAERVYDGDPKTASAQRTL